MRLVQLSGLYRELQNDDPRADMVTVVIHQLYANFDANLLEDAIRILNKALFENCVNNIFRYPRVLAVALYLKLDRIWEWFYELVMGRTSYDENPLVDTDLQEIYENAFLVYQTVDEAIENLSLREPSPSQVSEHMMSFRREFDGPVEGFDLRPYEGIFSELLCMKTQYAHMPGPYLRHFLKMHTYGTQALGIASKCGADELTRTMIERLPRYQYDSLCVVYTQSSERSVRLAKAKLGSELHSFCVSTFARLVDEDFEFDADLLQRYEESANILTDGIRMLQELLLLAMEFQRDILFRSLIGLTTWNGVRLDNYNHGGNSICPLLPLRSNFGDLSVGYEQLQEHLVRVANHYANHGE